MFYIKYLFAEIFRRIGKTLTIVFGLAIASAIIILIMSFSQGLSDSQKNVLNPLQNVGTDIMLTRSLSGEDLASMDDTTKAEFESENRMRMNFAELGDPGTTFSTDQFSTGSMLTYEANITEKLGSDVSSYAQGLILNISHMEGTVPDVSATITTGPRSFSINMNAEQQVALDEAMAQAQAEITALGLDPDSAEARDIIHKYRDAMRTTATITAPSETITQRIGPIQTDVNTTNLTISGVDTTKTDIGLILPSQIVSGTYFTGADNEIIVNKSYADKNGKNTGDIVTLAKVDYKIVGIAEPKLYTNTTDFYLPLGVLQTIANKTDRINILLVKTTSADNVEAVSTAVESLITGGTVVNSKDTADKVSGSLVQANKLTNKFIGITSIVIIVAAFVIVSLLTIFSINKRTREIGTLKAIGWNKWTVTRQILLENAILGVLGAAVGVGLGIAAIVLINHSDISFNATIESLNSAVNSTGFGGGGYLAAQAQRCKYRQHRRNSRKS